MRNKIIHWRYLLTLQSLALTVFVALLSFDSCAEPVKSLTPSEIQRIEMTFIQLANACPEDKDSITCYRGAAFAYSVCKRLTLRGFELGDCDRMMSEVEKRCVTDNADDCSDASQGLLTKILGDLLAIKQEHAPSENFEDEPGAPLEGISLSGKYLATFTPTYDSLHEVLRQAAGLNSRALASVVSPRRYYWVIEQDNTAIEIEEYPVRRDGGGNKDHLDIINFTESNGSFEIRYKQKYRDQDRNGTIHTEIRTTAIMFHPDKSAETVHSFSGSYEQTYGELETRRGESERIWSQKGTFRLSTDFGDKSMGLERTESRYSPPLPTQVDRSSSLACKGQCLELWRICDQGWMFAEDSSAWSAKCENDKATCLNGCR
jgi:hypothetical protein